MAKTDSQDGQRTRATNTVTSTGSKRRQRTRAASTDLREGRAAVEEMRIRHFRVAEANAMVPALSRLLERLQALLGEARARQRELELIKAVGYGEDGNLIMAADHREAKERLRSAVNEANEIIDSIQQAGCQLKSVELGLVDFPAVINGQEVLLCWRLGEPEVMYYHSWQDGFAGRRRLHPDDDDTPPPLPPPAP